MSDIKLDPQQCCKYDTDFDGNCHIHTPCLDCKKVGAWWAALGRCPECWEQLLADYKEKARS